MPQKLLQPSTAQRGFTLPELLIAAVIGLGVVGLGGMGLVSILGSSKSASAQTDRRAELNRSLEFIATEVRHADTIAQDAAAAAKPASFTSSLPITNAQPVLVLRLAAASEPIIYYIGAASDNTWLGPRVVYRWGPAYDVQGNFSNPTDPSNWTHEPLIDQIDDSSAQPTCPSSGMPKVNGLAGFFACVDSAGKVAEIHQMGQVSKPLGIKETYQVSSAVSTRPVAAVP
ncbi:MAG: prepilin-type N-terminal cleavage/methylation domain-containing protein, partial [Acaryochloridaceae cyanobacterium SU_2_1]|nr:prepilin-type N-terminal cleavage/methylation domain-containing protein [Acaryochloridaceae cyanobacterium SU_2_1]